ncbi:transposase, partial [Salinibacter ruber]|uniref:transposase n=1 Tax=Salinibacter ruber TaxID=146919 RepID=UPI00243445DB
MRRPPGDTRTAETPSSSGRSTPSYRVFTTYTPLTRRRKPSVRSSNRTISRLPPLETVLISTSVNRCLQKRWEQIKRYFATSRRRKYDLRYHVLDAILYIVKTGTQWRMLPGEFAQWQTVYYYFRRWRE